MTDQQIFELASIFRNAIIEARNQGCFHGDLTFWHFPRGCCGDTCYFLASFLKEYGVETIYVCGNRGRQSHAWLVVNDHRVKQPKPHLVGVDPQYRQLISLYGNDIAETIDKTRYTARDLTHGLVIDITADQFDEPAVYVGNRNEFYRRHTFNDAHICNGVHEYRLNKLYREIAEFLP